MYCCVKGMEIAENKLPCVLAGPQRSEELGVAGLNFWLEPVQDCVSCVLWHLFQESSRKDWRHRQRIVGALGTKPRC